MHDLLEAYFAAARSGDKEALVACFTSDAFYSHEAFDPGTNGPTGSRLEGIGHAGIRSVFAQRGRREWTHRTRLDVLGDRFYVEGQVHRGDLVVMTFLSAGEITDGLISRYVEYDSRPGVTQPPRDL